MNEIHQSEELQKKEESIEQIIDKNVGRMIDTYKYAQDKKYEEKKENRKVDKIILYVFSFMLFLCMIFMFYLISNNNLTPVTQILYPIIVGLIGFLSGYFAGSGRKEK